MTARAIIGIAAVLTFAGALRALAQEITHDISGVQVAPVGGVVAPELSEEERSRNELPELAGASLAVGSQLVDGRLPQPVIEYIVKTKFVLQRISLFDSGLVVVHVIDDRGKVLKRVRIPRDALDTYRNALSAEKMAEIPIAQLNLKATGDMAVLRSYDSMGSHVSRIFDPAAVLPLELEQARSLMQDLLNALVQDREVTSSITNYEPRVGDRLVGEDQKTYVVTQVDDKTRIIELTRADKPLKMYVAMSDLNKFVVGARRPASATP